MRYIYIYNFFPFHCKWLTKISKNQKVLISSKNILNLYSHIKKEFITGITLKMLNYQQDCELIYITFVNSNLSTVLRTLLIQYAIAAKILELHPITFITTKTIYNKGRTSCMHSGALFPIY